MTEAQPTTEQTTPEPAPEAGISLPDDDAALEAVWDKGNVTNGAERGADGRFASPNKEEGNPEPAQQPEEGEKQVAEGDGAPEGENGDPEPPQAAQMPSNWRGLEDVWEKVPEELRGPIAEHEGKLHRTLSEQGQELSALRPIGEVVQKNLDQFVDGQGNRISPNEGLEYLINVNRAFNQNPVDTLIEIADTFGVRAQVAQRLGGSEGAPEEGDQTYSALREQIAGLQQTIQELRNPASIDERIAEKLSEQNQIRDANDMISRMTKDMPLYAEIPEARMVHFINMAREDMADGTPPEEVFKRAYDMAVYADPKLRARAAPKEPPKTDPKRVDDAKRANGVNVTSTSSGKDRQLSEDEELAKVFDKHQ